MIPSFQPDGLLPPGDYEVSFDQLRRSILTVGLEVTAVTNSWDASWRERLVDNFEVLVQQLWLVGVRDIYADGRLWKIKTIPTTSTDTLYAA